MKHLIIGGNGTIGSIVAKELNKVGANVTIASRHPRKANDSDHLLTLDVMDEKDLQEKIRTFDTVHLILGLPYRSKTWLEGFPRAVTNITNALKGRNTKLIYFDNVYMYGKVTGWMTEDTLINLASAKGEARDQRQLK